MGLHLGISRNWLSCIDWSGTWVTCVAGWGDVATGGSCVLVDERVLLVAVPRPRLGLLRTVFCLGILKLADSRRALALAGHVVTEVNQECSHRH